ncbi:MAG TPA: ABC transporter permease [Polyangiaceae bacterium]|jgi:peptide/nickel transport system permease protein|nr:ABC transporter permease [Polyangiaceae bacterium]
MKLLKNLLKTPSFVLGMGLFLGTLLIAFLGPLVLNVDTATRVGLAFAPPSSGHWLGTDHLGIDMVSLLVRGLRSSLYVGFLAGTVATVVGTLIGLYGGYKGGLIDDLLTVGTNLFLVIPSLIVLILLSSSIENGRSLTLIALIIGCTTWTWSARAVRAQSSSLRGRDHVALARINGYGTLGIVLLHIMPYLLSYIFMVFILQTATGILSEASISMLGLGPYDSISLGNILNDAIKNEALTDGAWWAFMPAVVLITVIVFALYIINTSLEGVFNPRLRK